jgi:hypothetical protein
LKIKFEYNWKKESRKIRRLESISDEIKGEDSKIEVICIRFGHPTKKNEIVWGSPWEAAMAGLEAPWELMERSPERGNGKRGMGRGLGGGMAGGGGAWRCCAAHELSVVCVLNVRKERRKKKGEEKEKEGKEKKKRKEKNENLFKLENFWKIKDNLWSWLKIIFV